MKVDQIALGTILGGAIAEKFERALRSIASNVDDVNTDPTAKRKIAITIEFKPSADRKSAAVLGKVETKLAAARAATGTAFIGKDQGTGRFLMREYDPNQGALAFDGTKFSEQLDETSTDEEMN
ncbi:MAG: hypothetical protein GY715_14170 [Planctomycetes bacterium]|nr:hypothetical protein [Planctomycetota bacterium]